jgi:hypothetical protein
LKTAFNKYAPASIFFNLSLEISTLISVLSFAFILKVCSISKNTDENLNLTNTLNNKIDDRKKICFS